MPAKMYVETIETSGVDRGGQGGTTICSVGQDCKFVDKFLILSEKGLSLLSKS